MWGGARFPTLLLRTPRAPNHKCGCHEGGPAGKWEERPATERELGRSLPGMNPHSGQPRPPPPTPAPRAASAQPRTLPDRRRCEVGAERAPRAGEGHRHDLRKPPLPATDLCLPPRDSPPPPQPPPPRAHGAAAATVGASCASPLAGLRSPIPTPPQPPPVYNDWDRTRRAGPTRKRIPSSRRCRLPGSSSLQGRLKPSRANALCPRAQHPGRRSSRTRGPSLRDGPSSRKDTTTPRKHRASFGPEAR